MKSLERLACLQNQTRFREKDLSQLSTILLYGKSRDQKPFAHKFKTLTARPSVQTLLFENQLQSSSRKVLKEGELQPFCPPKSKDASLQCSTNKRTVVPGTWNQSNTDIERPSSLTSMKLSSILSSRNALTLTLFLTSRLKKLSTQSSFRWDLGLSSSCSGWAKFTSLSCLQPLLRAMQNQLWNLLN